MTTAAATLRGRLQRRVLIPLALVSLLCSAAVLTISYVSTSQALDRSLLDDAYAIAAHVTARDGRLVLDLTEREVGTALFDHSEQVFFVVSAPDGAVLAGDARLKGVTVGKGGWAFGRQAVGGEPLRTVTLRRERPQPFQVTVAQTTRDRTRWLGRLAAYALLPQLVLLIILAWWLGRSITEEVAPLGRLEEAVNQRDTTDLSPFDASATSREVESLARALNALMQRVNDGVAAQREFAGNVAHELRTPLAGIRALATYGLAHKEPDVWRQQLQAIIASEERASRLVEQLLALALADEAREGLQLRPLALDQLVADTVLRFLPVADAQGVELEASGLEQPVTVLGHAALLEGALGNLIHNALRHGRPRNGSVAVLSVELTSDGDELRVAVNDNGCGIAAGERQRLLQRWSQAGTQLELREGSGLGLAIAARYAALLGGRLTLGDAPGGGLSAMLRLRRA
jgi:two-component system sensor histidine kinase TctE